MRSYLYALIFLSSCLLISCESNVEAPDVVELVEIQLSIPEGFDAQLFQPTVTLVDQKTKEVFGTAVAKEGVATFQKVPRAFYYAEVSEEIPSEEFQKMAPGLAPDIQQSVLVYGGTEKMRVYTDPLVTMKFSLDTEWRLHSSLVISKIYSNGTEDLVGTPYLDDRYLEVYNNSRDTLKLDSLYYVGVVVNHADKEHQYLSEVLRFPSKNTTLLPGKHRVMAFFAKDHITDECPMSVNLVKRANYAQKFALSDKDKPLSSAAAMQDAYFADSEKTDFGGAYMSLVLFKATPDEFSSLERVEDATQGKSFIQLPNSYVVDAVQQVNMASDEACIHPCHDASAIVLGDQICVISDRKIAYRYPSGRIVLEDTNNSAADFVVISPRKLSGRPDHLYPGDYNKPEMY